MLNLKTLLVKPRGFGKCREGCSYYETGPAALCFACAHDTIISLAQPDQRCAVCDLPYEPNETFCGNPICNWPRHRRFFTWNYSIAMRSGEIERVIGRYKFNDRQHWANIFARVLVGFLEEKADLFRQFDLIVASPTYVGRDGTTRSWDHTRRVIEVAHVESRGEWPFDVGASKAIVKTTATPKMTKQSSWKQRNEIAQTALRNALHVPDRKRTEGKAILVYDDVFTDGQTLNEVARCLKLRGNARDICGITLARQPFRGRRATAS